MTEIVIKCRAVSQDVAERLRMSLRCQKVSSWLSPFRRPLLDFIDFRERVHGSTFAVDVLCARLIDQRNPRVRKSLARDSGAGNGCANFMGA